MSVKLKLRIGSGIAEIEAPTMKAAIQEASLFSEIPKRCGCCNRDDIALNHRRAGGHDFYGVRCRDCGAEFALGQRKEGDALFPRGPWTPARQRGGEMEMDHGTDDFRPATEPHR